MIKRVLIFCPNKQQQKAHTLSGWSNFVGKQTLFDQLNKLKKNMSTNNGRQHQRSHVPNDQNNNFTEPQDSQMRNNKMNHGEINHTNDNEYLNRHRWDNGNDIDYNRLQGAGKLVKT